MINRCHAIRAGIKRRVCGRLSTAVAKVRFRHFFCVLMLYCLHWTAYELSAVTVRRMTPSKHLWARWMFLHFFFFFFTFFRKLLPEWSSVLLALCQSQRSMNAWSEHRLLHRRAASIHCPTSDPATSPAKIKRKQTNSHAPCAPLALDHVRRYPKCAWRRSNGLAVSDGTESPDRGGRVQKWEACGAPRPRRGPCWKNKNLWTGIRWKTNTWTKSVGSNWTLRINTSIKNLIADRKSLSGKTTPRYCNSQSCKLLLQLIDNSATKGL